MALKTLQKRKTTLEFSFMKCLDKMNVAAAVVLIRAVV
jgi:hypothetical protein